MSTEGRQSFVTHAQWTGRNYWSAAVACSLLLLQVLSVLHLAVVRHTLCPEHGEPIHIPAAVVALRLYESPAAFSGQEAWREQVVQDASAPALLQLVHEHCLVQMHRRDLLSEAASVNAFFWQGSAGPLIAPDADHQLARSELLALAPKHSPPV